jgi:F-type H+-transporting ATPase subunit b
MKKFLIGPITDIMEKRRALIEEQLSNASNAEREAMGLKSQYEKTIEGVGIKTDQMLASARKNAGSEYDRIVKEADEKAGKIISDAEKTIRIEREKALREMQSEIAELAIVAATKIVSDNASENSNQSLYNDFLKKAGDSNETDRD